MHCLDLHSFRFRFCSNNPVLKVWVTGLRVKMLKIQNQWKGSSNWQGGVLGTVQHFPAKYSISIFSWPPEGVLSNFFFYKNSCCVLINEKCAEHKQLIWTSAPCSLMYLLFRSSSSWKWTSSHLTLCPRPPKFKTVLTSSCHKNMS